MRAWYVSRRLIGLLAATFVFLWTVAGVRGTGLLLHQTWKTHSVPAWARRAVSSCERANEGAMTSRLYSDADNEELVRKHVPEFLPAFQKMQGISQSDFARLLYMYIFAGVYADLDVYCVQPFSGLLEEMRAANAQIGFGHLELFAHDHPDAIPNAVLLATAPKHPFWMKAMSVCVRNVGKGNDLPIEQLCGPQALREALQEYVPSSCNLAADTMCGDVRLFPFHVLYPLSWSQQRIRPPICNSEDSLAQCLAVLSPRPHTITFWKKSWSDQVRRIIKTINPA